MDSIVIIIDVIPEVRYKRHNIRERTDDLAWHKRWDPVEYYYFTVLRPKETFDVVVVNE